MAQFCVSCFSRSTAWTSWESFMFYFRFLRSLFVPHRPVGFIRHSRVLWRRHTCPLSPENEKSVETHFFLICVVFVPDSFVEACFPSSYFGSCWFRRRGRTIFCSIFPHSSFCLTSCSNFSRVDPRRLPFTSARPLHIRGVLMG